MRIEDSAIFKHHPNYPALMKAISQEKRKRILGFLILTIAIFLLWKVATYTPVIYLSLWQIGGGMVSFFLLLSWCGGLITRTGERIKMWTSSYVDNVEGLAEAMGAQIEDLVKLTVDEIRLHGEHQLALRRDALSTLWKNHAASDLTRLTPDLRLILDKGIDDWTDNTRSSIRTLSSALQEFKLIPPEQGGGIMDP